MSNNIVHVTKGRVSLTGDPRGVLTPYERRLEVWAWAEENNIQIEYQGSLAKKTFGMLKMIKSVYGLC